MFAGSCSFNTELTVSWGELAITSRSSQHSSECPGRTLCRHPSHWNAQMVIKDCNYWREEEKEYFHRSPVIKRVSWETEKLKRYQQSVTLTLASRKQADNRKQHSGIVLIMSYNTHCILNTQTHKELWAQAGLCWFDVLEISSIAGFQWAVGWGELKMTCDFKSYVPILIALMWRLLNVL